MLRTVNEKAIVMGGIVTQSIICIEEMSELQKEITKYLRGKGIKGNLIEEIADVYICLDQLKLMYSVSEPELESMIAAKLRRTSEQLRSLPQYGKLVDRKGESYEK